MSSPVICEALSKRFRGVVALDDLRLDVPEGSIYALIGPNGAGKTTLIKILVNILRPTAGRALTLGTDSRRLAPFHFTQIGYVSENQELPEWMTPDSFLEYLKPFYPNWDDRLAAELLRGFELPADRPLKQLSRGMKMKTALASSLAYHPRLLLLDEPFTGLDPLVRDELIEGLLDRVEGTTVLISSHDLAEIESFASHVGFLDAGRMQFSEELTALAARFREIEVTLQTPPAVPSPWPETWLNPQTSAALVRFVDSRFEIHRSAEAISNFFPTATNVSIEPMSLRDIFVVLAHGKRKLAA